MADNSPAVAAESGREPESEPPLAQAEREAVAAVVAPTASAEPEAAALHALASHVPLPDAER